LRNEWARRGLSEPLVAARNRQREARGLMVKAGKPIDAGLVEAMASDKPPFLALVQGDAPAPPTPRQ
jgi:hypothetical protein